jgi:hypothetical protein
MKYKYICTYIRVNQQTWMKPRLWIVDLSKDVGFQRPPPFSTNTNQGTGTRHLLPNMTTIGKERSMSIVTPLCVKWG